MSKLKWFFKRQGVWFYIAVTATLILMVAFGLGLTVNSEYWGTENVLSDATVQYIVFSLLAICCGVALIVLPQFVKYTKLLYLLNACIGAFSMAAIAAMFYNSVVEIAYIYGEGNLEMGNAAAVNGSVVMFISIAMFVLAIILDLALCLLSFSSKDKAVVK